MKRSAEFSDDRKFRYALWRIWDHSRPLVLFVGLNPSVADENDDDETVDACIRFVRFWGEYGGVAIGNLFAFCDTKQKSIWKVPDPVGPENDSWLKKLAESARTVVAAWGNDGYRGGRSDTVRRLIPTLHCLKVNQSGQPHHPLYLPLATPLQPYNPRLNILPAKTMRPAPVKPDSVAKLSQSPGSNFFSSGLRQKVDQLMDILWAGGVNNPMDSIEQISYLLFLRLLTEKDELLATLDKKYKRIFSGAWSRYAWGNFVTLTGDNLFNAVRDAIEKLHELPGLTETGKLLFIRATLKIYDRPTLRAVVQAIHEMDLAPHDGHDLKGDMYEYLLSKLAASGTNGQFRTPRHIIDLIVALVNPQPGQRICDPAAGTAGFLISAFNHILRQHTNLLICGGALSMVHC
jgi:hypothetical protein